jgi:ATP-dependent exoDNAse (exonuclease V) beta subunit
MLYVACTRAREHLLLTGVTEASEDPADFRL